MGDEKANYVKIVNNTVLLKSKFSGEDHFFILG